MLSNVGRPDQILGERYRLVEPLGRGGMGSVWRAEHLALGTAVAVKLMDPETAQSPDFAARFRREAKAAASLRSPYVVQILDYGVDDGTPYIAMELLEGESLAARLDRVTRLSPAETVRVVTQVCRAVAKAHELGVVHRDLKPQNIFLTQHDDEQIAKVLDFGVAKAIGDSLGDSRGSTTRSGTLLGTPYYMSPEQAHGAKAVDRRSDLWSLGVIAYECLLGERPFESPALGELVLKICSHELPRPSEHGPVSARFDAWFARACNRDPAARFSSAKELAEALAAALLVAAPATLGDSGARADLADTAVAPSGPDAPATPRVSASSEPRSPAAAREAVPELVTGSRTGGLTTTPHGSTWGSKGRAARRGGPLLWTVAALAAVALAAGAWMLRGARPPALGASTSAGASAAA
jgi:serine/threonine-protein kinase